MGVMTDEQKKHFREEGYLLASGLIPEHVVRKAEDAMWAALEMDRDDSETWGRVSVHAINQQHRASPENRMMSSPDILACYTDDILIAVSELTGVDCEEIHAPTQVMTQNTFPTEGEWSHLKPHLDGGSDPVKYNRPTFPIPILVHSILYLSDTAPHGGCTFGWPGSHQKLQGIAEDNPEKYPYLWDVNSGKDTVAIGEGVELVAKRGDILFYQNFFCMQEARISMTILGLHVVIHGSGMLYD